MWWRLGAVSLVVIVDVLFWSIAFLLDVPMTHIFCLIVHSVLAAFLFILLLLWMWEKGGES